MLHTICLDCQRAEKSALRLIARAEQCTFGLIRKLEKRGFNSDCINEVIRKLSEQTLINDHRFAQLWLESRLRLTRSPRRLLASLCGRGINRDDAEAALKAVFDEETELAMLIRFVKKYPSKISQGDETRSLKYLLKNEGFSPQVIERFFEE